VGGITDETEFLGGVNPAGEFFVGVELRKLEL
jgi:hypothetical protein